MSEHKIFINRRHGSDRRVDMDPCKDMPIDIYHRKRRKSADRRAPNRSLIEDYSAFFGRGSSAHLKDPNKPGDLLN